METRFCIEYVNPRYPLHEDGSINVRYDRVLTLEQAEHDPNFTVLWILEKNGFPIENFLSPQEAATYAASEMADEHKEDAYDVEKLANEIMENFDENNGWHYEDYKCIKLSYS